MKARISLNIDISKEQIEEAINAYVREAIEDIVDQDCESIDNADIQIVFKIEDKKKLEAAEIIIKYNEFNLNR